LIHELEQLEGVIRLSVVREASVKPPGDVLTVDALNREADEVLRLADAAHKQGHVSVTTGEVTSIIDPEHERKVANDVDEALWEEAETGLRHQSQITTNYLALMALGGVVGGIGLVIEGTSRRSRSWRRRLSRPASSRWQRSRWAWPCAAWTWRERA
jgi:hypothetical protein